MFETYLLVESTKYKKKVCNIPAPVVRMLDLVVTLEAVDTFDAVVELGLSLEDRVLMLCATL